MGGAAATVTAPLPLHSGASSAAAGAHQNVSAFDLPLSYWPRRFFFRRITSSTPSQMSQVLSSHFTGWLRSPKSSFSPRTVTSSLQQSARSAARVVLFSEATATAAQSALCVVSAAPPTTARSYSPRRAEGHLHLLRRGAGRQAHKHLDVGLRLAPLDRVVPEAEPEQLRHNDLLPYEFCGEAGGVGAVTSVCLSALGAAAEAVLGYKNNQECRVVGPPCLEFDRLASMSS